MKDSKKIYEDIIKIIAEATGEPIQNLSLETTINIDLEIYGDDWDELMWPIIDKYPIDDFSEFEFSNHMRSEGDFSLIYLLEFILTIPRLITGALFYSFNKRIGKQIFSKRFFKILLYEKNPLYIADIYNSVLSGKWIYAKDTDRNLKQLIN